MTGVERVVRAGQTWAVLLVPVLLVVAAWVAENAVIMAAFLLLALPLAAALAVPLAVRRLIANRRGEATLPLPYVCATLAVWAAAAGVAACLATGAAGTALRAAEVVLVLAWVAQLATTMTRAAPLARANGLPS